MTMSVYAGLLRMPSPERTLNRDAVERFARCEGPFMKTSASHLTEYSSWSAHSQLIYVSGISSMSTPTTVVRCA